MKYTTLNNFQSWIRANLPDMPDPTPDDPAMAMCIAWAEEQVDCHTGSEFQAFTGTEAALDVSVDRYGALILHMYRPIVSISQVQILDPAGPLTWMIPTAVLMDVMPLGESARLGNYSAKVFTQPRFSGPLYKGRLMAQVTYTAGWATIPQSLQTCCLELAAFRYKRRDLPSGASAIPGVGAVAAGLEMPSDLMSFLDGWRNLPV